MCCDTKKLKEAKQQIRDDMSDGEGKKREQKKYFEVAIIYPS